MTNESSPVNAEFLAAIQEHEEALTRRANALYNGACSAAEDLVQDTVVKALVKEDLFEKGTNLRAWLFTILFNMFVNRHRRRKKYHEIVENHTPTLRSYTSAGSSVPKDHTSSMEQEAILALLEEHLDGIFYDVLDAVDVQDLSYKEAAALLEVPVGTVMSRLYRARRKAREVLVKRYDPIILEEYFSSTVLEEARSTQVRQGKSNESKQSRRPRVPGSDEVSGRHPAHDDVGPSLASPPSFG